MIDQDASRRSSSIAQLLDCNETRRVNERGAVEGLMRQMAQLEKTLHDRFAADDHPIKGALARMEARLDIIGKRSAAEQSARMSEKSGGPDADSVQRLEGKLNSILDALKIAPAATMESSHVALRAAQPSAVRRSLDAAISEIARRQDDLDDAARGRRLPQTPGEFSRPVVATRSEAKAGWLPFGGASERPETASSSGDPDLQKIEQRLEAVASRLDDALSSGHFASRPPVTSVDLAALTELVHELGDKIEAVQAPQTDSRAFTALQHQVEVLATRFAQSESGLSILPTLATSVRELFDQLDSTRASVEASATQAAREAIRLAAEEGRSLLPDAALVRAAQGAEPRLRESVARKTRPTLGAVHDMLDEVVGRLSTVEAGLAAPVAETSDSDSGPAARNLAAEPEPAPQRAAADERVPFDFAFRTKPSRDPIVPQADRKPVETPPPAKVDGLDIDVQRTEFIAAARRAAKAARAEPSMASFKRSPSTLPADKEARASLLARSRDYVAAHKRPVLMGVAAILMVLGTIAIVQQSILGGGSQTIATTGGAGAPIQSARVVDPATAVARPLPNIIAANELSPSALPKGAAPLANAIPGSDPIQTGSIPSLPAFAASGTGRPGLPAGLKAAAEGGNAAAQYDLGIRYAEGRDVPRDPKLAAVWLEKAADQGVAPAQYRLASIYEKGLGVTQDKAKAKRLDTLAAEAGNPRAMHNLAVLLADGEGHPDYAAAAVWFRKAAAYGVHDSQFNLAILLARGLGVPQSFVQSYQWFAIAAAHDDADAGRKRDEVATKLNANELAAAKAFAVDFRPKSASPTVTEVTPPAGGWTTGAASSSRVNSAKSKVSSL